MNNFCNSVLFLDVYDRDYLPSSAGFSVAVGATVAFLPLLLVHSYAFLQHMPCLLLEVDLF